MTPPFKPVVESDESTNNFDPEFTTADIREVGLADMDLDEEDPSEAWVSQSISGAPFTHTPNGPLGSERERLASKTTNPHGPLSSLNGNNVSQGIQIQAKKKKEPVGSPLTNSVQENFRGFTYSGGESLIVPLASMAGRRNHMEDDETAVDDEEANEVTTEDEFEDVRTSAGRYARRNGQADLDDDMS